MAKHQQEQRTISFDRYNCTFRPKFAITSSVIRLCPRKLSKRYFVARILRAEVCPHPIIPALAGAPQILFEQAPSVLFSSHSLSQGWHCHLLRVSVLDFSAELHSTATSESVSVCDVCWYVNPPLMCFLSKSDFYLRTGPQLRQWPVERIYRLGSRNKQVRSAVLDVHPMSFSLSLSSNTP